jgi:hypothetical protein
MATPKTLNDDSRIAGPDHADWNRAKGKLTELLSSKIYKGLLTDPGYSKMLWNAGLAQLADVKVGEKVPASHIADHKNWAAGKPLPNPPKVPAAGELTPAQGKSLREAARLEVDLTLLHLKGLKAVYQQGATAKLLTGDKFIYRVWDSAYQNATRHWWFSEELKNEAVAKSAMMGVTPQQWIRDALAVSLDWGQCDSLSRISLGRSGALPAIVAYGQPMPKRTLEVGYKSYKPADQEYWKMFGQKFRGKEIQYFLPFVPPEAIQAWSW